MIEGSALRSWLAAVIAAATTLLVFLLSRDLQLSVVTLVGSGAAAVVAATIGDDSAPGQPDVTDSTPDRLAPETLMEALTEPMLIVEGGLVAKANAAALAFLGAHIVGEDARLAIRHPAAADLLAQEGSIGRESVDLVGLGALGQLWQMRVAPLGADKRLVHLVDQTGRHVAERMRVDFVANASHELRTPLSSILGYSETLADAAGDDPELRRRFLAIVMAEAQRMRQLIDDLMSLSRIEAEKYRLPEQQVDLAVIAREVVAELSAQGQRAADIDLTVAEGVPRVVGDAVQLSQLLHNLIGNAMKYGRAGTPVRVDITTGRGEAVCVEVADEGEGIPPEHLPRLTERFYRVDAGRSRSVGGTGLGLAIVKHIVERHRGRLDIASEVGRGTRVTVTLRPVAAAPHPVSDDPGAPVMTAS